MERRESRESPARLNREDTAHQFFAGEPRAASSLVRDRDRLLPAARAGSADFFSLSKEALESLLVEELGCPRFRGEQLYRWVYKKGVTDLSAMTDLSVSLRSELRACLHFVPLPRLREDVSSDGTRKFLFAVPGRRAAGNRGSALLMEDGEPSELIESVLIKQPDRFTLCVSSQVGCGMACRFCRTGTLGLRRNLSVSEIVRQVVQVRVEAARRGEEFYNVVFMGMGEPLHNLENVRNAINILTDARGLGFSPRRITVSTVGLVPRIEEFFATGVKGRLAVSLNATTNETRSRIMPVNERYPLDCLLSSLRTLPLKHRDRVTIEYVLLHGVNDTDADLKRLPRLLKGIRCKVNLIPYNENAGLGFKAPPARWIERWAETLRAEHVSTTVRWSKGQDIDAACGQLAGKVALHDRAEMIL